MSITVVLPATTTVIGASGRIQKSSPMSTNGNVYLNGANRHLGGNKAGEAGEG